MADDKQRKEYRRIEDTIRERENRALKWAATALLALAVFFLMRLVNQLDKTAELAQSVAAQNAINSTQNAYVVSQMADVVKRVSDLERRMNPVKQNSHPAVPEKLPFYIEAWPLHPELPISPSVYLVGECAIQHRRTLPG